ncbi:hypothetical protein HDU88_003040 [Geranomyces variabilis]|nr:hypothetical protein HDU88_003040 [Geranomyces variabilis]
MADLYVSPEVFAALFPATAARRAAAGGGQRRYQRHEQQRPGRPACDFYALGRCRKGEQCLFRHDDESRQSTLATVPAAAASETPAAAPCTATIDEAAVKAAVPPPKAGPVAAASETLAVPATASEAPTVPTSTTSDNVVVETAVRPPEQCRFFLAGDCWRGDYCKFAHGDHPPTLEVRQGEDEKMRMMMPVCPYFAKGNCRYGSNCFFQHTTPEALEIASTSACPVEHENVDQAAAAPEVEEEEADVCGICLEVPSACQPARMYGLLEGCDHCFCRECVMQWRSGVPLDGNAASSTTSETDADINKQTKRSCPLCRVHSHLVMPSKQFLQGDAKAAYLDSVRARKAKIPCMYWKKTQRCPYHHWCLYAHHVEGKDMKPAQKLKWEQNRQQKVKRAPRRNRLPQDIWAALNAMFDDESDYYSDYDEFDSEEWETEEEDDEDEDEDEDEEEEDEEDDEDEGDDEAEDE